MNEAEARRLSMKIDSGGPYMTGLLAERLQVSERLDDAYVQVENSLQAGARTGERFGSINLERWARGAVRVPVSSASMRRE